MKNRQSNVGSQQKWAKNTGGFTDKKMAGFSWRFDGDIAVEMMVPNWLQVGELLEFSQVYGIPSGND